MFLQVSRPLAFLTHCSFPYARGASVLRTFLKPEIGLGSVDVNTPPPFSNVHISSSPVSPWILGQQRRTWKTASEL